MNKKKNQNQNLLHFGSLVSLKFYHEEENKMYFAKFEGFNKSNISLQSYEDLCGKGNLVNRLFKIQPSFLNQNFNKQNYHSIYEKRSIIKIQNLFKLLIEKRDELPLNLQYLEEEQVMNLEQYDKLKGTPIKFGQTLQFMHFSSGKYLTSDFQHVSDLEQQNLKLRLNEECTSETHFKIIPCFKHQQENEGYIYDNELIYIQYAGNQLKEEFYFHANQQCNKQNLNKVQNKKEFNLSQFDKSKIQIHIFSSFQEENSIFLQVCDVIWINCSEDQRQLIIGKQEQINSQSKKQYSNVLIFEKCSNEIQNNTNGMFVIESSEMKEGGIVRWDNFYKLRHLTTNLYLKASKTSSWQIDEFDSDNELKIFTLEQSFQKASLFKFHYIYSTLPIKNKQISTEYLLKDSYFEIQLIENQISSNNYMRIQEVPNEVFQFKEGRQEVCILPIISKKQNEKSIFKLGCVPSYENKVTKFLVSCQKIIQSSYEYLDPEYLSINDLQINIKFKIYTQRMSNLENCLKNLIQFCKNKFSIYILYDFEYGKINSFTQNVLREQFFIHLLIKILIISFPAQKDLKIISDISYKQQQAQEKQNEQENFQTDCRQSLLKENEITGKNKKFIQIKVHICQIVYELLSKICKNNKINQQQASKYLPLISFQSLYIIQGLNCILQIIKDNEELLLMLHKETIDQYHFDYECKYFIKNKFSLNQNKIMNENNESSMKVSSIQKMNAITFLSSLRQTKSHLLQSRKIEQYALIYNQIAVQLINSEEIQEEFPQLQINIFNINNIQKIRDLLNFIAQVLVNQNKFNIQQINIKWIKLLRQFCTLYGNGINTNQEIIYKYFDIAESSFIISQQIFFTISLQDKQLQSLLQQKIGNSFQQNQDVKYLCEQMEFYVSMCNGRNYNWKSFLEKTFKFDYLLENLDNNTNFNIKAKLLKLINKTYIDQDPMTIIKLPEYCKVLDVSELEIQQKSKKIKSDQKFDFQQQYLIKIIGQLKKNLQQVSSVLDQFVKIFKECQNKQNLDQIRKDYGIAIFNNFTFEFIRMLKQIQYFGYIELSIEKQIVVNLVQILQFDQVFPEGKMLLDQAEFGPQQKQKQKRLRIGKLAQGIIKKAKNLNIFDIINQTFASYEDKQIKRKKIKGINLIFQKEIQQNSDEQFVKQVEILKQILNKHFNNLQSKIDLKIKYEVCDIFDYFMNYKQEQMLNTLKNFFQNIIMNKKILDQEMIDKQILQIFENEIQENINKILPNIMNSGLNNSIPYLSSFELNSDNYDLNNVLQFNLLPSIISIFCWTQDYKLQKALLNLMRRFYNQRLELVKNSQQMIVLFDAENIQIFKILKKCIQELAKTYDESEKWLGSQEDDNNLTIIDQVTSSIKFFRDLLFSNSQLIKTNNLIVNSQLSKILEKYEIKIIQQKQVDPIRQDIMRHLNIYQYIINLVKDSIYILENIYKKYEYSIQQKLDKFFQFAFLYLTNFVKQNKANQETLVIYLDVLKQNWQLDLGQIELIIQIFKNNLKICTEHCLEVIDDFINLIITNGRQAKFLEFFQIILKINDTYILANQKAVLNSFFDPKVKQHILYIKQNKKNSQLMNFDFEQQKNNDRYLDQPYFYHAMLIKIFSLACEGNELLQQNSQKIRNQFSLKYFLKLLQKNDYFLYDDAVNLNEQNINDTEQIQLNKEPKFDSQLQLEKLGIIQMKKELIRLIYYCFIESGNKSENLLNYIEDVIQLVHFEKKRQQIIKNEDKIVNKQFAIYLLNGFLPLINQLFKKSLNGKIEKIKEDNNNMQILIQEYKDFASNLLLNLKYFQPYIKKFQKNLKKLIENLDLEFNLNIKSVSKNEDISILVNQNQPSLKKLSWQELYSLFIKEFVNGKLINQKIKEEQKEFSCAIYNCQRIFPKDSKMLEIVNLNELLKKLISFLQRSFVDKSAYEISKFIIQSLINYIYYQDQSQEVQIQLKGKNQKEIEEFWQNQKVLNQNMINMNNATYIIMKQLSELHQENEIFYPLLKLGISLLDDGNKEVQKKIFQYFSTSPKSETFFYIIHQRILKEIDHIKKKMNEEIPLYESSQIQNQNFQLKDEIYIILRFLQLLTEGHNLNLQNYIRLQNNSYHQFDIIDDIIQLQAKYLEIKWPCFYQNMIQTFDTLTEFIQGPCLGNQEALIIGNFLETISSLINIDEKKIKIIKEIYQQNQQDLQQFDLQELSLLKNRMPECMVANLKYKCSITLLSLLEARQGSDLVQRMLKTLQLEEILRNITDNFILKTKLYGQNYSSDCFNHFTMEYSTQQNCNFIIETGFNFFVLYTNFRDIEKDTINQDQNNLKKNNDKLTNNILKNLGNLGMPFFKGGISYISQKSKLFQSLKQQKKTEARQQYNKQNYFIEIEKERKNNQENSLQFFAINTAHIEIQRNNRIEICYFYIPPYCQVLANDKQTKTQFHETVSRISVKSKVSGLILQSNDIISKIKHEYWLREQLKKIKFLEILAAYMNFFKDLAFIFAIAINMMCLFSYQYYKNENSQLYLDNIKTRSIIKAFGITIIFMAFIIVGYYLAKAAPFLIKKAWSGFNKDKINIFAYAGRCLRTIIYLKSDFFIIYYLTYGITAVIGTFYNPFFFVFHLFDILVRFPELKNVVQSVWIPKKSIILTGFLFIILLYFFTLIAYFYFDQYYEYGFCSSTWQCFLTSLDKNFKTDGGIGGFLISTSSSENSNNEFLSRFIFDNLFFIIIMIIMLNIILAIIIDQFSSLREVHKQYTFDKNNFCYICGIPRENFDKIQGNNVYQKHINEDHYLWNYLFFIAYLKDKQKTEYTGQESYVQDLIEKNDISWFPIYRSLQITEIQEQNQNSISQYQIIKQEEEELQAQLNRLKQTVEILEQQIEKDKLQQSQ